ncbi:hypothetical protein ILUMI_09736 [Ignelater luminosus]|uniref:Uncharacterized protein n=1 Tax=Ignelater luminosus TaxID=2038154 RepID=A0A8K0GFP1_IGNLU|nr:hypothetical protein ILUMI_09736 [Ignelater luminosus]
MGGQAEVLMLSTKHTAAMMDVHQRGGVVQKPASFLAVNKLLLKGTYHTEEHEEQSVFKNLLEYTLRKDPKLADCYRLIPKNATSLSPEIQNDVIQVLTNCVREASLIMFCNSEIFGTEDKGEEQLERPCVIGSTLKDFIMETTGAEEDYSTISLQQIFVKILHVILTELQRKFTNNTDLLEALTAAKELSAYEKVKYLSSFVTPIPSIEDSHDHPKLEGGLINRQKVNNRVKRKAVDGPSQRPSKLIQAESLEQSETLETLSNSDLKYIRNNINSTKLKLLPKLPRSSNEVQEYLDSISVATLQEESFL